MPYTNEPWEDPLFPKNIPPFDPSKYGTRLGANPNALKADILPDGTFGLGPNMTTPSSWFPYDVNTSAYKYDPSGKPIFSDMYPASHFTPGTGTGRDFLHNPRFSGLSNDELASILKAWGEAGFTPKDLYELSVPPSQYNYKIGPSLSDDEWAMNQSGKDMSKLKTERNYKKMPKDMQETINYLLNSDVSDFVKEELEREARSGTPLGNWWKDKKLEDAFGKMNNAPFDRSKISNFDTINRYQSALKSAYGSARNFAEEILHGASTVKGNAILTAALSAPDAERRYIQQKMAAESPTTIADAALYGRSMADAVADGLTMGMTDLIQYGPSSSPNLAFLLGKIHPGLLNQFAGGSREVRLRQERQAKASKEAWEAREAANAVRNTQGRAPGY